MAITTTTKDQQSTQNHGLRERGAGTSAVEILDPCPHPSAPAPGGLADIKPTDRQPPTHLTRQKYGVASVSFTFHPARPGEPTKAHDKCIIYSRDTIVFSFASSEGLADAPRKALSGEALAFHQKLEGFALRWMLAKHPGLGEPAIREILAANNQQVLPMLGPYNLLEGPGLVATMGIPMAPPQPPAELVLPEGIRRMRELQRSPTPRR